MASIEAEHFLQALRSNEGTAPAAADGAGAGALVALGPQDMNAAWAAEVRKQQQEQQQKEQQPAAAESMQPDKVA